MKPAVAYECDRDKVASKVKAAYAAQDRVALRKTTSNLFRRRDSPSRLAIDVRNLNHVLSIDSANRLAVVEGMTTYDDLVRAALRHSMLPCVTPELKTITVGGAISGLGIESTSFRFGLVHETIQDIDVLTGDGSVLRCSREVNEELFYALPNSYGTLGYILRATVRLMPAPPFVRVTHRCYDRPSAYLEAIEAAAADSDIDFVDGMILDERHLYLTTGRLQDGAPSVSDYRYRQIYYKSIPRLSVDHLRAEDYVWRWDTDWFWCSKQFGVQHAFVRLLATPWLLNSRTYQKIMRLSQRLLPDSGRTESVIQDVAIPFENANAFLRFLLDEIPIRPIWTCALRTFDDSERYILYPAKPGMYLNFGFWDGLQARQDPTYYNRRIEAATATLGGRKALYSSSYYDAATFESQFRYNEYEKLKRQYDPKGLFGNLYEKCVLRH